MRTRARAKERKKIFYFLFFIFGGMRSVLPRLIHFHSPILL